MTRRVAMNTRLIIMNAQFYACLSRHPYTEKVEEALKLYPRHAQAQFELVNADHLPDTLLAVSSTDIRKYALLGQYDMMVTELGWLHVKVADYLRTLKLTRS